MWSPRRLPCDSEWVTGDTESERERPSIVCLVSPQGGNEDNEETDEFEAITLTLVVMTVNILAGDGQSTETTDGRV